MTNAEQPTATQEIEILRAEIDAVRKEAEVRSTFLATVSHEIREPMNGVLGMARLLRESRLDDEQSKYVDAIVDSGEALLTIINDILDISKVDAGKLELVEMDFDLNQFFDRLRAIVEPRARLKNLEFIVEVADDAPKVIRADPGRMRQVLLNLCGNSVKFTEAGSVTIKVFGFDGDPSNTSDHGISIRVIDTGPGIPEDVRTRLFSAYAQGNASIPRLFGGSGLGLMIVEKLVQAMAGTISVESRIGEGTEFRIDLALKAPGRIDGTKHRSVAVSGSTALIVDEVERSRKDIDAMLSSWKVSARLAKSLEQGNAILNEAADRGQPIDVVLLDSDGKEQPALDLVKAVRSNPRLAGSAIVVMASSGLRGDAARAAAAGADAYLRKPLDPDRLLKCLQSLAGWDRHRDGIMTVHTLDDRITDKLKILVVDDNELNCKLAEILLKKAGHSVTTASNGEEGLAMIERQDFDAVLMDIQMPVMDGLSATRAIRGMTNERKSSLPVIALTANAMAGTDQDCRDAGMNEYVTKPINGPELMATIEKVIN